MTDFQGKATLSKLPTSLSGTDRFSRDSNSIKVAYIIMGKKIFRGRQFYQSCLHHYGELIDFQGKVVLTKLLISLSGTDRFSGEGNSIKVAYIIMGN